MLQRVQEAPRLWMQQAPAGVLQRAPGAAGVGCPAELLEGGHRRDRGVRAGEARGDTRRPRARPLPRADRPHASGARLERLHHLQVVRCGIRAPFEHGPQAKGRIPPEEEARAGRVHAARPRKVPSGVSRAGGRRVRWRLGDGHGAGRAPRHGVPAHPSTPPHPFSARAPHCGEDLPLR